MPSTLTQQTYDVIANHLTESEREIEWPHLDTKGHITIGVGFKIDNEDKFAALDLTTIKGGKAVPATNDEKRTAYRRMKEIHNELDRDLNKKVDFYNGKTSVFMFPDAIDEKLRNEIEDRVGKIRTEVGDAAWGELNDAQKAAIIDIDYANGDGNLKGFPALKKVIIDGEPMVMADQSTFYTNKEKGERHLERLQRNYQALSGLEREVSNKALAGLLEKLETERQEEKDKEATTEETQSTDEELENTVGLAPRDENIDNKDSTATDTLTSKENDGLRQLTNTLSQPGDAVDDALLKDDLTEKELKFLMRSGAYLQPSDPRHKQAQIRTKQWFDDHWGVGPARVDATGRMISDGKPKISFPHKSDSPTEPLTRRPLDTGVRKVAKRVADRARLTTPFEAVKSLQSSLNSHNDLDARPFPPLKEDSVVGPKTSRALRFATKRLGASGLLNGLFG